MRPAGVPGGMGPEATVLFMSHVIVAVPAADDADHVPLIVDQNRQMPGRLDAILGGRGKDPGPVLAAIARRLAWAGAWAPAMPYDAAHHVAPQVPAAAGVPFPDMAETAAARDEPMRRPGPSEIAALTGPREPMRHRLPRAVSDDHVTGGHLIGAAVRATAGIVLLLLPDLVLARAPWSLPGCDELTIRPAP